MAKHIGRQTISFEKTIMIGGEYAIAGKEESEGPLGANFDEIVFDDGGCKKSYELCEVEILERCY
jgi:hypothetical protein